RAGAQAARLESQSQVLDGGSGGFGSRPGGGGQPLAAARLRQRGAGAARDRRRAQQLSGLFVVLVCAAALTVAYRYYSAFLSAKVLAWDASRLTPAHRLKDGANYVPTNRWVLFGHHFAAITGAGPLIGPVLAAQFGYFPGLAWLVVGVCLAGA